MNPTKISYEQFGKQLIELVLTPRRIGPVIHASLPNQLFSEVPVPTGKVTAMIDILKPNVTRVRIDILRLDLNLSIKLRLDALGVIHDEGTVSVVVPIYLQIETWTPLLIFLNTRAVTPQEVRLAVQAGGILGILDRLGVVQEQLADSISKQINEKVAGSLKQRTIDLLREINKSFPESRAPSGEAHITSNEGGSGEIDPNAAGEIPSEGWAPIDAAAVSSASTFAAGAATSGEMSAGGASPEEAITVGDGQKLQHRFETAGSAFYKIHIEKGQRIHFYWYAQGQTEFTWSLHEMWGGQVYGISPVQLNASGFDWSQHDSYSIPMDEGGDYLLRLTSKGPVTFRTKPFQIES